MNMAERQRKLQRQREQRQRCAKPAFASKPPHKPNSA
jgi:hypothetical protein